MPIDNDDNDPRIRCRECAIMFFPPEEIDICEHCEEFFCSDCKPEHKCWTEGPS